MNSLFGQKDSLFAGAGNCCNQLNPLGNLLQKPRQEAGIVQNFQEFPVFSLPAGNRHSGFSLPARMRNRASMSAARIVADICLGRASALLVEATRCARRYHYLGAKIAVGARLPGEAAHLP
jgi:hypothetical protein